MKSSNIIPNYIFSGLTVFKELLKRRYGNNLDKVILFGSYARGDFDSESDVDVVVLFRSAEDEFLRTERKFIVKEANRFFDNYEKLLMPIEYNSKTFHERATYVPFYRTVKNEGIEI
jgi:predicted nucleotidyltransferase